MLLLMLQNLSSSCIWYKKLLGFAEDGTPIGEATCNNLPLAQWVLLGGFFREELHRAMATSRQCPRMRKNCLVAAKAAEV
jgi:hypothetical protein